MKARKWFKQAASLMLALAVVALIAATSVQAAPKPWKFGVMGDTQWTCPDDPAGTNPTTVPVSIINQVNQQINAGVKFVIEVGDLTDSGNDADEAIRAAAAQPLYNAGIGFFPFRGNHETYGTANGFGIAGFQANYPQTRGLGTTWGATNFSSPVSVSPDLNGMSYSFDYNNARFVIVDPWVTPSKDVPAAGYDYGYSIAQQQPWIDGRLNLATRGTPHAFVFSHQPLIAENHQDCPFVGYTNANPAMQNAFYASLQNNDVGYYISGHDHVHQRSLIASPDGLSQIHEIICASNSSKFYTPKSLTDPNWFGQKVRETSVSQETYHVGYYIFTVDGPRVTVDYYSDDHTDPNLWGSDNQYPNIPVNAPSPKPAGTHITPTFNFVKKDTWGYSLNGAEFLVPQSATYVGIKDSFAGTTAAILSGTNGSTATNYNGRHFTKTVDTGWSPMTLEIASDALTLWGIADLGTMGQTDVYTLSMNYDPRRMDFFALLTGQFCLGARDASGDWMNAVDGNVGGVKKFVLGPWNPKYGLGTYGVDLMKKTAWAVVNHDGDFAVSDLVWQSWLDWLFN